MSFSNTEYLYEHLPSRFRREDKDLFLKRFLQPFGETLDGYDAAFDAFHSNINPDTASEIWIEFWLENLFGWSWFPRWFTLADKRRLYGNFAKHLARRGTVKGIEQWLADFGIRARVYARPGFVGEMVWGEPELYLSNPLVILIEILRAEMPQPVEMSAVGAGAIGESFYQSVAPLFTAGELNALLRYVQPQAQEIALVTRVGDNQPPILRGYTVTNSVPTRTLDAHDAGLNDLLNFAATLAFDLDANLGNTFDASHFTPTRGLDGETAEQSDLLNFVATMTVDLKSSRRLGNYAFANFTPLRTLDANDATLSDLLNFVLTMASDLGAIDTTP